MHRTQTEYEDALSFKMYMFQFVNFYSSIFYIAFVQGRFNGSPPDYNRLAGYRQEEVKRGVAKILLGGGYIEGLLRY